MLLVLTPTRGVRVGSLRASDREIGAPAATASMACCCITANAFCSRCCCCSAASASFSVVAAREVAAVARIVVSPWRFLNWPERLAMLSEMLFATLITSALVRCWAGATLLVVAIAISATSFDSSALCRAMSIFAACFLRLRAAIFWATWAFCRPTAGCFFVNSSSNRRCPSANAGGKSLCSGTRTPSARASAWRSDITCCCSMCRACCTSTSSPLAPVFSSSNALCLCLCSLYTTTATDNASRPAATIG
mmetsp:Transcript_45031/g.66084  ORF Transcript_45031/g.66084 Transcript_45031/m.66084 type:complete len:250 (+) Transcript_45031:418-1167(+)